MLFTSSLNSKLDDLKTFPIESDDVLNRICHCWQLWIIFRINFDKIDEDFE